MVNKLKMQNNLQPQENIVDFDTHGKLYPLAAIGAPAKWFHFAFGIGRDYPAGWQQLIGAGGPLFAGFSGIPQAGMRWPM